MMTSDAENLPSSSSQKENDSEAISESFEMDLEGEEIDLEEFFKQKKIFKKNALVLLNKPLSLDEDEVFLFYKTPIQVVNLLSSEDPNDRVPYVLSVFIDSKFMADTDNLCISAGNTVELTKETQCIRRNVFELVRGNFDSDRPVKYNDIFHIKLYDSGQKKNYYVSCLIPSYESIGKDPSGFEYPLYLSSEMNETTEFQCIAFDNNEFRDVGCISFENTMRIKHVKTGSFLVNTAETNFLSLCGNGYQVRGVRDLSQYSKNYYWLICSDMNKPDSQPA